MSEFVQFGKVGYALRFGTSMENLLTRKLEAFGALPDRDRAFLDTVIGAPRLAPADKDFISEGDQPDHVFLVLEGLACRYKHLGNGSRQIVGFLVPGDLCDLHIFILKKMDHGILALSPCKVVEIRRERVLEMLERPALARALWWMTLVDEATLREWLVNMGRREAEERIAHLFCELHARLDMVGLVTGGRFELPLTQLELADTVGISTVHANRALQALRATGLIKADRNRIEILDLQGLKRLSGFNPAYLHKETGKQDRS